MKKYFKQMIEIGSILIGLIVIQGCAVNKSLVVFDDSYKSDFRWISMNAEKETKVQDLDILLLRNYCTYEVKTKNMEDGQNAKLQLGGAVYPSVIPNNHESFPVELFVYTRAPFKPHENHPGDLKMTNEGNRLHWKASAARVPSHFGYFEYLTQGIVTSVWMTRECTPLENGRACVTVTIRATKPYLIRVWNVRHDIKVDPETITPKGLELSNNGVIFFNYSKLGEISEISFVVSGLDKNELYYPMTNAMLYVPMRSKGFPENALKEIQGKAWNYEFILKSRQGFRISSLERWTNEEYKLEELIVKND